MGIIIRVAGANFEKNAVAFIPPISEGLEYWNVFGEGRDPKRNLAQGKPGSGVVGSPVYNPNSVILHSGKDYIATGVADTPSMTLIAVSRALVDANAFIVSNYKSPRSSNVAVQTFGKSLAYNVWAANDGRVVPAQYASRFDGATGPSSAEAITLTATVADTPAVNEWSALVGRADESAKTISIVNRSSGKSASKTTVALASDVGGTMRIGGAYATDSYDNAVEVAAVIIYSRVLSDAEVSQVYEFLKGFYSRRGMVI